MAAKARSSPIRNAYVLTGGSRGLGKALCSELLSHDHEGAVLLTSRSSSTAASVAASLNEEHPGRVFSCECDTSIYRDVAHLASFAHDCFGTELHSETWLLNSGSNGFEVKPLTDCSPNTLRDITNTNVLGTLNCAHAAATRLQQLRSGRLILVEGAGSDGSSSRLLASYGFSKAGVRQLRSSLDAELSGYGISVHTLNPGLVNTDLLASGAGAFGKLGTAFLNLAAEEPATAARVLAPQLVNLSPRRKRISALQPEKIALRAVRRLIDERTSKDRFFIEETDSI